MTERSIPILVVHPSLELPQCTFFFENAVAVNHRHYHLQLPDLVFGDRHVIPVDDYPRPLLDWCADATLTLMECQEDHRIDFDRT